MAGIPRLDAFLIVCCFFDCLWSSFRPYFAAYRGRGILADGIPGRGSLDSLAFFRDFLLLTKFLREIPFAEIRESEAGVPGRFFGIGGPVPDSFQDGFSTCGAHRVISPPRSIRNTVMASHMAWLWRNPRHRK